MKKGYAHISVVLDRSGSMSSCSRDTIGGFNQFLGDQKKVEGEATMTMIQFDNEYQILMDMVPLSEALDLNERNYIPRGGTALLDAIGRTINRVEHQINEKEEPEKPEKVIFVIITDGEENESKEFNREQIMQMINRHREEMGWEFVFIGANQDAIQAGNGLGVRVGSSMNYNSTGQGTRVMYSSLTQGMNLYRSLALDDVQDKDYAFFDTTHAEEVDAEKKKDEFLKNPKGVVQNMSVGYDTENTKGTK